MERQIFDAAADGDLTFLKNALEPLTKEERIRLLSDKTAGAGATPLIAACHYGHLDVAEYLIKSCGADVELEGSGRSVEGGVEEAGTPLWYAANAGHFDVVKLLVENHANVNASTTRDSTPLRSACFDGRFDIVQCLIDAGADMDEVNNLGQTCLMVSCYRNDLAIAKYMIEKGVDINRKSVKAETALHYCAESGALSIMTLLLGKGAKFDVDSSGLTPLLTAALHGRTRVVEHILTVPNLVTLKEKANALELLGATFVDKKRNMMGALRLWQRALDLRYRNGQLVFPKPKKASPVYEGRREIDRYEELEVLMADLDDMRMQALMIRERVLGPGHPETTFYIRYRGAVYGDAGQFNRCIAFWIHALNMYQEVLKPLNKLTQQSFICFTELFWFMMRDAQDRFDPSPVVTFEVAYVVFWKAVFEIERAMNHADNTSGKPRDLVSFHCLLVSTLQIIAVLASLKKVDIEDYEFRRITYNLIKANPKGSGGWTLLHMACSSNSSVGKFTKGTFPSPKTVEFLVSVGADVNARDDEGNTPLHVAADPKSCSIELVQTLLKNGAHLDERNDAGNTFEELAKVKLSSLVDPMPHITLKCLAAQVVSRHKVNYGERRVHASLESFIQLH